MKKRIVAILLSLVTLFSIAVTPVGAATARENSKKVDIVDVWQNGYAMPDIGDIFEVLFEVNKIMYEATGLPIFSNEVIVVTVDSTLQGVVDAMLEETGVDFSKIYKNLPQSNQLAEIVTSTLQLDIPATQEMLTDLSRDYFAQGNIVMGAVIRIVELWMGIVDSVELTTKPYPEEPGCEEIGFIVTYRDGRTESVYSGILYNTISNEFVGKNGEPALLGYSLDLNQNYVYTGINVWQRSMGFNIFYDIFCYLTPFFFHYTTQRIKFVYEGQDWMFQIWKGRYAIANGGELGIYTRDESKNGSFYDCASDEDMLVMSIAVYHGDELIFKREPMLHWWVTGFAISDTAYLPWTLTVVATIEMKDEEMLSVVKEALDKKKGIIDYEVDGLEVTLTW